MDEKLKAYAGLSKKRLFRRLHALALPLGRLGDAQGEDSGPVPFPGGTDGSQVFWPPAVPKDPPDCSCTMFGERLLLHETLHCLLGHPFRRPPSGRAAADAFSRWDLLCDLAVWHMVKELAPELFPPELSGLWEEALFLFSGRLSGLLPGGLIPEGGPPAGEETDGTAEFERKLLAILSSLDDHSRWPAKKPDSRTARPGSGGGGPGDGWEALARSIRAPGGLLSPDPGVRRKGRRAVGARAGNASFRPVLTDSRLGDYRSLLLELASWGEDLHLSPSEFDQASYLYGLETCGIPFLEPLEYEEAKRIRELAIVIDTSGSCSGPLVQAFLEETRNLILEEDLFFHPFNLHIIQCDSKVQRDDKITCREDLADYIENLEVHGMGGTDYVPAFSHIAALQASGEFTRLSGILYFTDGLGLYPQEKPEAETVFIFIDSQYEAMDVPSWARTLVLRLEEPKGTRHEY